MTFHKLERLCCRAKETLVQIKDPYNSAICIVVKATDF